MSIHVLVHFIVNILILLPFLYKNVFYLFFIPLIIVVTHFIIDESKISYDLKHDKKVIPFLADQLLHVIVLIMISTKFDFLELTVSGSKFYDIYLNNGLIIFVLLAIFISEIIDIYLFQEQREENKKATLKQDKKIKIERILMFSLVYFIFILLIKTL